MSTELENSNAAAQELLLEEVIHTVQEKNPKLVNRIGMVTLIMALASAVGGLMAGITSNEAMNERTQEVVDVIHLQNDNAELREIKTKHEILRALNVPADPNEATQIENWTAQKEKDLALIHGDIETVEKIFLLHEAFALGVTLLSIAITLCGLTLITNYKMTWLISLIVGSLGGSLVIGGMVVWLM